MAKCKSRVAALIQRLQSGELRDSAGNLLVKPKPPGMRVIEKGAWTYRELKPGDPGYEEALKKALGRR